MCVSRTFYIVYTSKMEIKIFDTAAEAAQFTAELIAEQVISKPNCSLGVATGRTMDAIYHNLVQLARRDSIDFSDVKAFAVDEYIGLNFDSPNSYRAYLNLHLFDQLNFSKENQFIPDVHREDIDQACLDYEKKLEECDHIDLQLLGIGTNGHIGLNEPGSALDSRTRIVGLTSATKNSNKSLFVGEKIPETAASIGVGTVLDSKKCLLIATGETKAEIIQSLVNGDVTSKLPASALKHHKNCMLILDKASAKLL